MTPLRHLVSGTVIAFLTVKLLVLLTNLWSFPTLPDPRRRSRWRRRAKTSVPDVGPITMLVPARNEAVRLQQSFDGLLAAGADEVVFLDDQSTDGTAQVIRSLAERVGETTRVGVRVVQGSERPPGWVGKTWACAQLGAINNTDLLVFCDADVDLAPGALAAVITEMRKQDADVFSVICRQRAVSWGERLLTPLITDVVLCLFPFGLLRAPAPSAATAEGMLLVFRRAAYDQLGGFAAVRDELVEDVAIARLTRRCGLQLGLVLGGEMVQCRMYTDYRAVIDGLGRGLVPVVGGRRWVVALGWLFHLLAYTVPVVLLSRSAWWRWAAVLGVSERLLVEAKAGSRDWVAALLVPASPLAALPVVVRAMRRTQTWKGRQYG